MVHASNAGVPNLQKPVEEALGFLANKWRNADGSFGTGVTQGVHTIYSALALQGAQQAHFQLPGKDYDADALSWLRMNPREARTMVEEYVRIDPQPNGPANYQYTFVTDALLVRVLTASSVQEHRQSKFASEALTSLGEDFDDASGGFYGRHVFSWATAWALKALQEAEQVYPEVPEPKPDPPGARIGTYVLLLAVIELAVTVYLIHTHQLSTLIISFLILLMFATLLAFGLIGEKTFSGIIEKIFGGSNK